MKKSWPTLPNPPVIIALFQLKFEMGSSKLEDFLRFDTQLRKDFPHRNQNIEASIDMPSTPIPLGISKVTGTSNAKIKSYIYFSADQKCKLTINEGSLTYIDESKYTSWEDFNKRVDKYLTLFASILEKHLINRISIRFINQFIFETFNDPTDYFKTLISTTEEQGLTYPVTKYSFKLVLDINENIYSIINQNLNKVSDKYIYIFDIDVLDKSNLIFDVASVNGLLQDLRFIKNDIFFSNITDKTIELCS